MTLTEVDLEYRRLGGKAPRRPYRFGPRDVAAATGLSLRRVWLDRRKGLYNPDDLYSLSKYVAGFPAPHRPVDQPM